MMQYTDNNYSMNKLWIYSAAIIMAGLLFFTACDENIISDGINGDYYVEITVIKDVDLDSAAVFVTITKDGSLLETALVNFDIYPLIYDNVNDVYMRAFSGSATFGSGVYACVIADGTDFNDTAFVTIPQTVSITDIALPEDRVNPAGDDVQIQWSQSLLSDEYVFAVNHVDSIYNTDGYSAFSPDGNPQATVPRDAFRPGGILDPVLGWYYVYVCSITGTPKDASYLPTDFPEGLDNNIDQNNFTGSYGVIVISERDSINVTESL